jgi:hypothetical protein
MAAIFTDRFILLPQPGGGAELYIRDPESIVAVRTDDIERAGLPPDTIRGVWRLGGALRCEPDDGPCLIFIDRLGGIRDTYRSADPWLQIVARVREVTRAA